MNEQMKSQLVDPSWSDPDAAVAFLVALRGKGPWIVSAIYPSAGSKRATGDVGPVPTRTFHDPQRLRAWIAARSGIANLYFTANPVGVIDRKPSESDITGVAFVHVDIDEDEQGPIAGDVGRKKRVVDALNAHKVPGPPTFIIDSGGGVQALWRLYEEVSSLEDRDYCRGINRRLVEMFGGDGATFNLDRLLRLPGTVNLPDVRKLKRGRVPVPTKLIQSRVNKFASFEFESAPVKRKVAADLDIGDAVMTDDLEALVREYGLPKRLVTIIRDGRLAEPKRDDDSRSVWLYDAICGLLRCKVPPEIIVGLLIDPQWQISESVLEKPDPEAYAARQVKSAAGKLQQQAATEFDADADEDWPRSLSYTLGKKINATNGRLFVSARPGRIVTSDGVIFGLDQNVWREVTEDALRFEIRKTNPTDTLDVDNIGAMVRAVRDLTHTTARPFEWIDPPKDAPEPKDLVLFRNGVLNIKTGELMPLDGSYFATALPNFDYDAGATCPTWLTWIGERLDPSFHATLQEWMGYVIVPDTTAHRFATFTGPPRSGKSTSKNIIEQLVGSDHIARKQLADMGKEFGLQDAVDKRLIVIPDAKDAPVSQRGQALERILAVTGGDITGVPRKYLPAVSVKLLTRLLVLGNRQPAWIDESGALAARQIAIVFDRSFEGKEDQAVEDRLMSELPGIANWALEGLKRLRANGYKFTIGDAGRAAVAEVRRSASPALRFAEDCLKVTGNPDDVVLIDEVYAVYEDWAFHEGLHGTRSKTDLMTDLETSLHNVKQTQTRKLPVPPSWRGGEYRPRVLQGVKSVVRSWSD